jgi:hypothetical protein
MPIASTNSTMPVNARYIAPPPCGPQLSLRGTRGAEALRHECRHVGLATVIERRTGCRRSFRFAILGIGLFRNKGKGTGLIWRGTNSRKCGNGMCKKCADIDRKIELLRRMMEELVDPETTKAAKDLVKIMEAEKARYHPE